jgi:integrase
MASAIGRYCMAVCAGLRVSELTGLKIEDIDLPSMSICVLGKGRRERTLPLWKTTATALRAWLAVRGWVAAPEVFVNARGEPLTRWGFAYLLKQHVATAARHKPGLKKKRVSPHVLRHTCAMIVLQATGDIRKLSLWLGHAMLTSTEVYTRGNPTEKLDAREARGCRTRCQHPWQINRTPTWRCSPRRGRGPCLTNPKETDITTMIQRLRPRLRRNWCDRSEQGF